MEKIKEKFKKIPKDWFIVLGFAFLLMSFTLFKSISFGHDYSFHIANIFGIDQYLEPLKGTFIPSKIIPIVGYGFGYGTGIFYPPLVHVITNYVYLFIKYIGFNLPQTMELIKFGILFLSGISMYYLVKRISKNKQVSLISAVSYMSAPYFLSDIYVRCAYAEIATFIFIPIVFRGLYELFYGKKDLFYIYFIIGYSGMILSHLVITVYLTIFIFILLLLKIKTLFLDKKVLHLINASIIILMMTSFFYVPMLEHKLFGNYVVFQENMMSTSGGMAQHQLSLGEFFSMNGFRLEPNLHLGLNIVVLILAVASLYHNKFYKRKENKEVCVGICVFIVISMLFTSTIIPWDKLPSILQMIQFPWRLLTFICFGISFLAGFFLFQLPKEQHKLATLIFVTSIVIFGMNSISTSSIGSPNISIDMSLSGMGYQHEYLPVNTIKNEKYLEKRDHKVHVVDGNAKMKIKEDKVPNLSFEVKLQSDFATLEIPRIYYLGYDIILTTKQGDRKKLEYVENKNGFIEITLQDSGVVSIKYKGTILDRVCNMISLLSIIGFGGWILIKKYQR